jgi:hypothetical protein
MKPLPTFCRCEVLTSNWHAYLGSFFLEPEDMKYKNLGATWRFSKAAGLPSVMFGAQRAGLKRPRCIAVDRPRTHLPIYRLTCDLYCAVSVRVIRSADTGNVVPVATFTEGCLSSNGSLCMWWHSRMFGNSVLLPIRCCSHSPGGTRWTKSMS